MTTNEFAEWLAYFDACFPSYRDKRCRGDMTVQIEAAWMHLMSDVGLRQAKLATQAAMREEIQGITAMTPWDKYPQAIRAKARELMWHSTQNATGASKRNRLADGEWTYACQKCQDTGWIEIVSQKSIDDSKNFEVWMETGFVWPSLAACSCEGGQKFSTWKKPIPLKRSEMRQAIDFPGILDRPRTPIAWRNWLLDQVRKGHEWNHDSQPTEYVF